MRTVGSRLRWLLAAAAVLVTASCGARGPGPIAPAGSGAPTATAPSASSAVPSASSQRSATPAGSARATAMIFGVVREGPTCPIDPVYHACRARPLGHVEVQALSPGARRVASVWTRADGHYAIQLPPGSYVLVVMITQVFPRCPRRQVSIGSGAAFRANINCDSGIRRQLGPPATNPA